MFKALLSASLLLLAGSVWAQATPVGLWKTIDDETKQEKSHVRISESNGVLTGKIEKIVDPTKLDSKCVKCSDERKDQPIVGMVIFKGPKQDAKDKAIWEGGEILDPSKGKSYRMRLRVLEDGKKLEMRGYIAFLHRDQEWIRAE